MQCACAVLYCHLVSWLALSYFTTLSNQRYNFRGKSYWTQNCVLDFSTTFVWKMSHSKENSARYYHKCGDRGSTVVKVLWYKSEGRWFDSRWCNLNFSLTQSFRSHYGPGVDSASNRNEYQEYFLGLKAAVRKADNLTTILGHCHGIWEPQLPGTLWAPRACNGNDLPFFNLLS